MLDFVALWFFYMSVVMVSFCASGFFRIESQVTFASRNESKMIVESKIKVCRTLTMRSNEIVHRSRRRFFSSYREAALSQICGRRLEGPCLCAYARGLAAIHGYRACVIIGKRRPPLGP